MVNNKEQHPLSLSSCSVFNLGCHVLPAWRVLEIGGCRPLGRSQPEAELEQLAALLETHSAMSFPFHSSMATSICWSAPSRMCRICGSLQPFAKCMLSCLMPIPSHPKWRFCWPPDCGVGEVAGPRDHHPYRARTALTIIKVILIHMYMIAGFQQEAAFGCQSISNLFRGAALLYSSSKPNQAGLNTDSQPFTAYSLKGVL